MELKDIKEIQKTINEIPNVINPCTLCVNYDDLKKRYSDNGCLSCCYYYGSQFEFEGTKEDCEK